MDVHVSMASAEIKSYVHEGRDEGVPSFGRKHREPPSKPLH